MFYELSAWFQVSFKQRLCQAEAQTLLLDKLLIMCNHLHDSAFSDGFSCIQPRELQCFGISSRVSPRQYTCSNDPGPRYTYIGTTLA